MPALLSFLSDPYGIQHAEYQKEREQKARAKKLAEEQATPATSEMAYFEDPYGQEGLEYKSGFTKVKQNLKGAARGASYAPQDLLGLPADTGNMLLTPFGLGSQRPVGGSNWLIDKGHEYFPQFVAKRTGELDEDIGRAAVGLINPAGVVRGVAMGAARASPHIFKAGQAALSDIARGSENFMTNQSGFPQAVDRFVPGGMRNPEGPTSAGGPLYAVKPKGGGGNWIQPFKPENADHDLRPRTDDYAVIHDWEQSVPMETRDAARKVMREKRDNELWWVHKRQNELLEWSLDKGNPKFAKFGPRDEFVKEADGDIHNAHMLEYDKLETTRERYEKEHFDAEDFLQAADNISREQGLTPPDEFRFKNELEQKWLQGPLRSYFDNQFASTKDPIRDLVDQGIVPMEKGLSRYIRPDNTLSETSIADIAAHRTKMGQDPEGLATTPVGKRYEEESDNSVSGFRAGDVSKQGKFREDLVAKTPFIKDLPEKRPDEFLYSMSDHNLPNSISKNLFKEFQDLYKSGEIYSDSSMTKKGSVEALARRYGTRRTKEIAAENASGEGIAKWAQERVKTIPSDTEFKDGTRIGVIKQGDDPELIKRDLSLHTCALNHCVGSGGYDGKHLPLVYPHSGVRPKGTRDNATTSYLDSVLRGDSEIRGIYDKKGMPHATMEWQVVSRNADGSPQTYEIDQFYGVGDGRVANEYHENLRDYLNQNHDSIADISKASLENIGSQESSAGTLKLLFFNGYAGDSAVKEQRTMAKLITAVKKEAKNNGDKRAVTEGNVFQRLLEMNNLHYIPYDDKKGYKALLGKYLKE